MSEEPISSEELIRKVLAELQRRFRLAGRGTVGRVERQLGLGAGYFKDQRRPGRQRFDLKILFKALDALGVEPAEFFASILGSADPVDAFKAEAAVLRRVKSEPRILALEHQRARRGGPSRRQLDLEETVSELEVLDGLRYQDPGLAMRRTRPLVEQVADSQVPLVLGVYASASREAGHHDEAQVVLARALDLAEELHDYEVRGDLLLRAGDVMAARGEVEIAYALAERASLTFAKSGNLAGIGRSLVDQGIWLGFLDRPRKALRALRAARSYFPADTPDSDEEPAPLIQRSRFLCLLSLGLLHRRQGDLEAARRILEEAGRETRGVNKGLVGRLLELQASIARQAGRHPEAESLWRQAFEVFQPIDPLDAALCGVELARLQLHQAKAVEADGTVQALLPLLEPLETNPVASDALAELVRSALTGPRQAGPRQAGPRQAGQGLSPALLQRVAQKLEAARAPGSGLLAEGRPAEGPLTALAGRRIAPRRGDLPADRAPREAAPARGAGASDPCRGKRREDLRA